MRTLWLLLELEADFALQVYPFDRTLRSEAFLTLSPAGRVPALEIDGEVMFESGAMTEILCERFQDAGMACHRAPGAVTLFDGVPLRFDMPDPLSAARDIGSGDLVEAPMPGRVTHVSIATGDRVQAGDRLLTLEAMKMEHQLRAPRDGVVARVSVSPGLQVQAGDIMVALEEVSS